MTEPTTDTQPIKFVNSRAILVGYNNLDQVAEDFNMPEEAAISAIGKFIVSDINTKAYQILSKDEIGEYYDTEGIQDKDGYLEITPR